MKKPRIQITCEKCGAEGTMEMPFDIPEGMPFELHAGGGVHTDQPCPKCGGKISAPSGHYKMNKKRQMVRVGDAQAEPPKAS